MRRKIYIIVATLLIFVPASLLATLPQPKGFVNDFAHVLSQDTQTSLENMLSAFETSTNNEVAVVTLPSLDGEPVENVAVSLFEKWGIGKKGKDNGVLFLIAPNERKVRIEVGYGLEGAINDALAGRIMDEAVIPRFRAGDMDLGIAAGTLAIVKTISSKEGLDFDADSAYGAGAASLAPDVKEKSGPFELIGKILIFLVMIYLFIRHPWLFLFFLSSVGRGSIGGRGFGGSFGGFGGGLSGGGGASRGW
jgi:uncharacterized protein